MDDRARRALDASTRRWRDDVSRADPADVDVGADSCALCVEFAGDGCRGCPVSERTGRASCLGTPYLQAFSALRAWREAPGDARRRKEWVVAACVEVLFLVSLGENPRG